jgi:thymidylate kinase
MVVREYYMTRRDGVRLFRTYSDKNLYIIQEQTNDLYDEAIDVENAPYTYIESTQPIEEVQEDVLHQ